MKVPIRDQDAPSSALANPVVAPSPYFGTEQVWDYAGQRAQPDDGSGRAGLLHGADPLAQESAGVLRGRVRPSVGEGVLRSRGTPDGFVQNSRQVTVYDPKTKQFTFIDTCFGTHHLNFAEDANNTLWLSNNLQNELAVVGWVNTKLFWETRRRGQVAGLDAAHRRHQRQRQARRLRRAQPAGRSRQGQAHRARLLRHRLQPGSTAPSGDRTSAIPATSCGCQPGSNPSETALAEVYRGPAARLRHARLRHRPSRRGVGDAGERTHRQLRPSQVQGRLNGPGAAEGNLCPEGWTFYPLPGPSFAGRDGAAEVPYYTWVDQHDILGLGAEHADRDRQFLGLTARADVRQGRRAARPLPDGLLRQRRGRPHR